MNLKRLPVRQTKEKYDMGMAKVTDKCPYFVCVDYKGFLFTIKTNFIGEASNKKFNPHYRYSNKIKEQADKAMPIRETFEALGERGKN